MSNLNGPWSVFNHCCFSLDIALLLKSKFKYRIDQIDCRSSFINSGQKRIKMELPTLNLPIANNIVVSKAGSTGRKRRIIIMTTLHCQDVRSCLSPPRAFCDVWVWEDTERGPGPEQSQDVSELRPVFGISPRSSSPSRPPALQHDEYKNWWVIDKTGPVEDRGFILHINYRAIFHYSQPLSFWQHWISGAFLVLW